MSVVGHNNIELDVRLKTLTAGFSEHDIYNAVTSFNAIVSTAITGIPDQS